MKVQDIVSIWIINMLSTIWSGRISEFLNIQHHLLEALNTTDRRSHSSNGYRRPYRPQDGAHHLDTYIPSDIPDEYPRKAYRTNNVYLDLNSQSVPGKRTSSIFGKMQQFPSYNIPETVSNTPVISYHPTRAQSVIYNSVIPSTSSDLYNSVYLQADKRHMTEKYSAQIEILLVVDNSIFRKYLRANSYSVTAAKEKIKEYFSILFAMVDQRFTTISDPHLSVGVYVCDIIIAETRRDAGMIEYLARWSNSRNNGIVNASKALRRFHKWLRIAKGLPEYDHAVIVTSYLLSKRKRPVEGLAYVGTICKVSVGKSASIVQDNGDFQSASVIAHELGHSLGVSHDGEGVNTACPASRNYVMAPQNYGVPGTAANIYRFSWCSIKQMKNMIKSKQGSCLQNTPTTVAFSHNLWARPPGKMMDENMQCQIAFGQSYEFCDQASLRSTICEQLYCISPEENAVTCRTSNRLMALPGTPCGYDKHCHLGECVPRISNRLTPLLHSVYERLKFRDPSCLSDGNHAYCSVIIRASPYLCNRPNLQKYCCESCAKRKNNNIDA